MSSNFICAIPKLAILVSLVLTLESLHSEPPLQQVAVELINSNIKQFENDSALSLTVDSKVSFTEEYRSRNPKEDLSDAHGRIDHTKYYEEGGDFAFTISKSFADGRTVDDSQATFRDNTLSVLDRQSSIVYMKKGSVQGHGSFEVKNPYFCIYAFLRDFQNSNQFSPVTFSDIRNQEIWSQLLSQKDSSFAEKTVDGEKVIEFSTKNAEGVGTIVRFQSSPPYLPISFQRLNPEGQPIRTVSVSKWIQDPKAKIWMPEKTIVDMFYSKGFKVAVAEMTIKDFAWEKQLDSTVFEINPLAADYIYDADNKVTIKVPR